MKTGLSTLIFCILLGLIQFTSCKSKNKNEFATFPNNIDMGSVRAEEIRIDNCIFPADIIVHDSLVLISDIRDENMFLKIYNSQTGVFIKGVGAMGKGPNEYINPSGMKFFPNFNTFWLMEPPKKLIHKIPLSQLISAVDSELVPTATIKLGGQMMINDYYQKSDTTLLIYNPTSDNLYSEMDINGNIVRIYGSNNNKKVSDNNIANFIYYRGVFTIHNNKAFLFYNLLNKITTFNFETLAKFDRLGDNFIDIIPEVHESGNLLNNYTSFVSHANSYNSLVFIAYKGGRLFNEEEMRPNYSTTIFAFNENIEPVAKLNFPFSIINYTICEKGMLYAIPENFDSIIYKYDLTLTPSLQAKVK